MLCGFYHNEEMEWGWAKKNDSHLAQECHKHPYNQQRHRKLCESSLLIFQKSSYAQGGVYPKTKIVTVHILS